MLEDNSSHSVLVDPSNGRKQCIFIIQNMWNFCGISIPEDIQNLTR